MSSGRIWLAGLAVVVGVAAGEAGPVLRPMRDVDVVYAVDAGRGAPLREELRWDVAAQALRVDPPTAGLYVIIDLRARRMSTVRMADRMVIEAPAPPGATGLPEGAASGATRQGGDVIAGLACTDWLLTDAAGEKVVVCLTADGVLLRARAGDRTLLTAASVRYGPSDPGLYQVPADYSHKVLGARP